jgi:hypothetical protein
MAVSDYGYYAYVTTPRHTRDMRDTWARGGRGRYDKGGYVSLPARLSATLAVGVEAGFRTGRAAALGQHVRA